jgi:DNA-3-methyladenine glycosylase
MAHLPANQSPLHRHASSKTIGRQFSRTRNPSRRLTRAFFTRDAATVARDLIGTILVRRHDGIVRRARIVETEAYIGPHDLACHAAKGRTPRTETMFLPGGHAYVYFIYGIYDMLNIVTGKKNDPQAVLIRAAEPLDDWHANLSGPGKLTRALHITRKDNRTDLTRGNLYFLARPHEPRILATPRIGVDYAKHWKDEMLRFIDADSNAVSAKKISQTRPQR